MPERRLQVEGILFYRMEVGGSGWNFCLYLVQFWANLSEEPWNGDHALSFVLQGDRVPCRPWSLLIHIRPLVEQNEIMMVGKMLLVLPCEGGQNVSACAYGFLCFAVLIIFRRVSSVGFITARCHTFGLQTKWAVHGSHQLTTGALGFCGEDEGGLCRELQSPIFSNGMYACCAGQDGVGSLCDTGRAVKTLGREGLLDV